MRRKVINIRLLFLLCVLLLIAGGAALLTANPTPPAHSAAARADGFDAEAVLSPVKAAPPLALHNYLGQRVNINSYRGKAVLVTFLYTNCPDICPLITSDLRVALNLMGPATASKVQIIAVSVDPRRDTAKAVSAFLARHEMTGHMLYLIGSAGELAPVWKAWGVGSSRDLEQPQFINHTAIVYGITASGKRLTIYPSSFQPSEIAHDVPLLAAR